MKRTMFFQTNSETAMTIIIFFLYILKIPVNAAGISCFKCIASQSSYEDTDLLCSQFDGSARFQVYCPASTLCMKKTIYYKIKTNVTKAVQRDCAPQKRTIPIYSDVDNKWHSEEEVVKTAYEEDCFIGEDKGTPAGPPEYCFCSYHLCNSSESMNMNVRYMFFLILMLLYMK